MSPKTAEKHKTTFVKTRIEPELKEQAESILKAIGMTTTQAIALYYRQIWLNRGIPFDVRLPEETIQAIDDIENRRATTRYDSKQAMYDKLGISC